MFLTVGIEIIFNERAMPKSDEEIVLYPLIKWIDHKKDYMKKFAIISQALWFLPGLMIVLIRKMPKKK